MDNLFKSNHLLLPELNYELKIRKTITEKPVEDKRKILGRLIAKERQQNFDVSSLTIPNFDFALEVTEIETTLSSIENLISDFEGPSTDSCFKRANSRLIHVNHRIQRIPIEGTNDQEKDIIRKFKNEAYATALKLEADLFDKVKDTYPNTLLNNSVLDPNVLNSTLYPPIVVPGSSKSIPVYKLGIQFDGNPKKLLSFIEKVEEVSSARNVSKNDLFQSASDLFSDKATFWFHQVKASVNSWDSLVTKLKKDFLASDFEDEVWIQINTRRQGRNEPVVIYIACMETLFSRLTHSRVEVTKVKYVKQGLQPEYQKRLALSEIDSLESLSKLCKKLEEADVLSLTSTSGSSHKCSLDPELAYISDCSSLNFKTKCGIFPNRNHSKNINKNKNVNRNNPNKKNNFTKNTHSKKNTSGNYPNNKNRSDNLKELWPCKPHFQKLFITGQKEILFKMWCTRSDH